MREGGGEGGGEGGKHDLTVPAHLLRRRIIIPMMIIIMIIIIIGARWCSISLGNAAPNQQTSRQRSVDKLFG